MRILIVVSVSLSHFVFASNNCYTKEKTWSTEGLLEFLPNLDFQECTEEFILNGNAKGFTWFLEFESYGEICILFNTLANEQDCTNCISIEWDDDCKCGEQDGECDIEQNNLISGSNTKSQLECYIVCLDTDGCNYYTWFYEKELCLLFTSCEKVSPCSTGCTIGMVDCNDWTTTETPTIETTTTQYDPCDGMEYYILDDATRSMEYGIEDSFCDDSGDSHISPDWKGASWYKIEGDAGTRIPEEVVPRLHCNTYASGWLNGRHPTTIGETVETVVCFNYYDNSCHWQIEIQIKQCLNYYLYYLKDTHDCYLRYCSQ